MKDLFTVIKFTMKDMVKRKSFIVSTIIFLVMIVVGFNIPQILKKIKGEDIGSKLIIVDENNVFEGSLETLKDIDTRYNIEIAEIRYEEIKEKIEDGDIESAIIIEKQDENIKVRYIVKNTTMLDGMPEDLISAINTLYSNLQISKLGLTEEQLKSITPNFEFSLEQTEEEKANGNIFAMMLLSIVLFYAIYFCAYQVSSSITTEKTSKIIETLVTSTAPRTIVLGKTIGIGVVGLLQMILLVGTALISAKVFLEPGILENIIDISTITPYLGMVTILYFILGYLTYALLYALTGSTVSKPEDIQSASGPVAMLAVIGFYLSYFTMMNPTSQLNVFASIFPISSPFCMPFRVMMGLANTTDVLISIVVLIITILVIAKVTIKIYSNAILNYGTKMGIKDIIKVYNDKNSCIDYNDLSNSKSYNKNIFKCYFKLWYQNGH